MLRDILTRFINNKSNTPPEALVANLAKHKQVEHYAIALRTYQGKSFNPILAAGVKLSVADNNIDKFIERLLRYIELMESKSSISPTSFYVEYSSVTLDQFFTDEEGYYIPIRRLVAFVDVCLTLVELFDKLQESDPKEFAYIQRISTKTIASILNIFTAINEARN